MGKVIGHRFVLSDDPPRLGGMGRVHRAIDVSTNPPRNVAVKIIGPIDSDGLVELFFTKEVEALRSLRHPNIVNLLDAGIDAESGESYIVLDWVESDLLQILENGPIPFDDFVGQIALPLAAALAAAHERHIIHRDVKPSNVLIAADGTPLLADFGISKIKTSLSATPQTTAEFMSRPYAPPEHESTSSYTRDVYGFGVLMLRCLVETAIEDYPDIRVALDELDATQELCGLIERCVDFEPSNRPSNGSLLFAELRTLYERRRARWEKELSIFLEISRKARETLTDHQSVGDGNLEDFIARDLSDAPAMKPLTTADEALGVLHERQFFLFGTTFSYRVVVQIDGTRPPALLIIGIHEPDQQQMDRAREDNCLVGNASFRFGQVINHSEARTDLEALIRSIDLFADEQQRAAEEREHTRLLSEWRRQIAARESIEIGRELPAQFSKAELDGRRMRVTVGTGLGGISIGEIRRLESGEKQRRGPTVRGEVERIEDDVVTVYLESVPEGFPARGRFVVDTSAAQIKIDREKNALSALTFSGNDIVRPELRELIIDPATARPPVPVGVNSWVQAELDSDKCSAVSIALGGEDLFLVQGPPGTGKTTFIAELVAQELQRNPHALILIASQTNVALDNALVRIDRLGTGARLIRLADARANRVSEEAEPFLLENQMEKWIGIVSARSQAFLDEWCTIHGVGHARVRTALALQEMADLRRSAAHLEAVMERLRNELEQLENSSNAAQVESERADLLEQHDELRAQIRDLERDDQSAWKRLTATGDVEDIESDATPEVLIAASGRLLETAGDRADELKALVATQAEWLQRLGKGEEFVEPLLIGSQVLGATCVGIARYRALRTVEFDLCIIDEASKATATETLVPMVRARRWVLVGDQKQLPPFQEDALRNSNVQDEFDLDVDELRTTLFDRFAQALPSSNMVMLRTQRRMTKAIGEMISECFYGGELISEGPEPLGPVSGALPKAVTWVSTSRLPNRHEQADRVETMSYVNQEEAREVVALLRRVSRWYRPTDPDSRLGVLVLAPYRAQVAQLRHRIAGVQPDVPNLAIEVNTIDAVQGREADLVVFSVTRSNPQNNFGFLSAEARANVALSRARRGLIIVGDSDFCRSTPGPLGDVLSHIERRPEDCALEEVSQ